MMYLLFCHTTGGWCGQRMSTHAPALCDSPTLGPCHTWRISLVPFSCSFATVVCRHVVVPRTRVVHCTSHSMYMCYFCCCQYPSLAATASSACSQRWSERSHTAAARGRVRHPRPTGGAPTFWGQSAQPELPVASHTESSVPSSACLGSADGLQR